jgi:hypothetical protein
VSTPAPDIKATIQRGDEFITAAEGFADQRLQAVAAAGKQYLKAQKLCLDAGLSWDSEFPKYTTKSRATVYRAMKVAAAPDPAAEASAQRAKHAGQEAKRRNTAKIHRAHANGIDAARSGKPDKPAHHDLGSDLADAAWRKGYQEETARMASHTCETDSLTMVQEAVKNLSIQDFETFKRWFRAYVGGQEKQAA